jgi:hypothetical protein
VSTARMEVWYRFLSKVEKYHAQAVLLMFNDGMFDGRFPALHHAFHPFSPFSLNSARPSLPPQWGACDFRIVPPCRTSPAQRSGNR